MNVKISPGGQSCNWCQGKPYQCFVCNRIITFRDKHLLEHFNNPDQYLTCRQCKVYKYVSQFRFKKFCCRLCTYSQISIVLNYN